MAVFRSTLPDGSFQPPGARCREGWRPPEPPARELGGGGVGDPLEGEGIAGRETKRLLDMRLRFVGAAVDEHGEPEPRLSVGQIGIKGQRALELGNALSAPVAVDQHPAQDCVRPSVVGSQRQHFGQRRFGGGELRRPVGHLVTGSHRLVDARHVPERREVVRVGLLVAVLSIQSLASVHADTFEDELRGALHLPQTAQIVWPPRTALDAGSLVDPAFRIIAHERRL